MFFVCAFRNGKKTNGGVFAEKVMIIFLYRLIFTVFTLN